MKPRQSEKLERDVDRLLHAEPLPADEPTSAPRYYSDKRPAIIATLIVLCLAVAAGTWLVLKYRQATTPVQPAAISLLARRY